MRLLLVQCAVLDQETFCDHVESIIYLLRKGPVEWSDQDVDSLANEIEKLCSYASPYNSDFSRKESKMLEFLSSFFNEIDDHPTANSRQKLTALAKEADKYQDALEESELNYIEWIEHNRNLLQELRKELIAGGVLLPHQQRYLLATLNATNCFN